MHARYTNRTLFFVIVLTTLIVLLACGGPSNKDAAPLTQRAEMIEPPQLQLISPKIEVVLGDTRHWHSYVYDQGSEQCMIMITHVHQMGLTPVDCESIGWDLAHETQHR
jgi:hypothetical protein